MNFFKTTSGTLGKLFLIAVLFTCFGSMGFAYGQTSKPQLYMVSVGIANYKVNPLVSPPKDAQDMSNLFKAQEGKLFSQVQTNPLLNEQATVSNIYNALNWVKARANADSYTIVSLAGHGTNRNATGEFEFIAYDGKVRWTDLKVALKEVPGRVILILDSCHSGALEGSGNVIVLSSSLAHQTSGETNQNGYFTQSLLEALNGKADSNNDGTITLAEVYSYVSNRLAVISNGKQLCTFLPSPNTPGVLPLAMINASVTTTIPATQTTIQVTGPINPVTQPNFQTSSQSSFQASGPLSFNK